MKKMVLVLMAMVLGIATSAFAQPFTPSMTADVYDSTPDAVATPNDDNDGLPDVNDAINVLLDTTYANNENVDSLQIGSDAKWMQISPSDFILIGLTAGNTNNLYVYGIVPPTGSQLVIGPDSGFGYKVVNPGSLLDVGDATNPFTDYATSPLAVGDIFGWQLTSNSKTWDSDPVNNASGLDHMLTYQLDALTGQTVYLNAGVGVAPIAYTFKNPYLIAWEDLPLSGGKLGDEDYDDMMYVVDGVIPIPEPMSMLLLGSGLVGLFGLRRKNS